VPEQMYDVIQIGRGPVGMTSAALLARAGHRVALVERHTGLYGHPRAGHIDHEIARILASIDCAGPVLADAYPTVDYVWKNAAGEVLIEFEWGAQGVSGYNSDYMMFQPLIDQAVADRLERDPRVETWFGWEAAACRQHADHVEVELRRTRREPGTDRLTLTGEAKTVSARYLIGSDGAGSTVRGWTGTGQDDLGFEERWMVVDALRKRELRKFDPDCGQICDPRRPITILPLGKRHRRWEWFIFRHEESEHFNRPETAWALLAEQGVTPDDVEIIRQIVYTFAGRIAHQWRNGRIFLMGDAAHTMPPFMGQGMCSGLRDALNLGWKLDLVLRGLAPDTLLDSYQQERHAHVRDWTLISIETGKLPCTVDPEAARRRDENIRNGWRPPMPDFPKLSAGILHREADGSLRAPVGDLGIQGRVAMGGRIDRFDALHPGAAFTILSTTGDPGRALRADQAARLAGLPVVLRRIGRPGSGAEAIDVDGTYADWFARHGIEALVVRPDFYVFGASGLAGLPAVIDDLLDQLGVR